MQKAILYCRVSTREQAETGHSLEAQQELLRQYATAKGFSIVETIAVPERASGARERLHFAQMLLSARKAGVRHILTEKVDRISRNFKEAIKLQDWIEEDANHHIHFVKQSLVIGQNSKSSDTFMWDIFLSMARQYSRNLSEEVKKGQRVAVSKGLFPSSQKIGYLSHGGHGVSSSHKPRYPDPRYKKIITEIFVRLAGGTPTSAVWQWVKKEDKLKTTTGNRIHRGRFYSFIRDPFICGQFIYNGVLHEGQHEAIISKELFYKVQDLLDKRTNHIKQKHSYIYQGLAFDMEGIRMYCMTPKNYPYYYNKQGLYILERNIDEAVIKWFAGLQLTDSGIAQLKNACRAYMDSFAIQRRDERESAMKQINLLEARLKTAQDKMLDGVMSDSDYSQLTARIHAERAHILCTLPENQIPKENELEPMSFILKTLKNLYKAYPRLPRDAKRTIAQLFLLELKCDKQNIIIQAKPEVQALLTPLKSVSGALDKDTILSILKHVNQYKSMEDILRS